MADLTRQERAVYNQILEECRREVTQRNEKNWKDDGVAQRVSYGSSSPKHAAVPDKAAYFHGEGLAESSADFEAAKNASPRLGLRRREAVNNLCDAVIKMNKEELSKNALEAAALSLMAERSTTFPKFKEQALEDGAAIAQASQALNEKKAAADKVIRHLNGEPDANGQPPPAPTGAEMQAAQSLAKLDPEKLTPEADPDYGTTWQNFHAENAPGADIEKFSNKMLKSGNITQQEMDYGVALFDRNLSGMYGKGRADLDPSDPKYLKKFDNIYIDGHSVSSICGEVLQGKSDVEKSNYMKCYVAAAALERKKNIECVFENPETGFADVRPLRTRVKEPDPPKKSFFGGLVDRVKGVFGISVKPPPTKQDLYEQSLANRKPSPLEDAKNFQLKTDNEANALGKALYGKDFKVKGNLTGVHTPEFQAGNNHINIGRSGINLGIALLSENHSIEDIMDPNKLQKEKREAGDKIKQWYKDTRPDNPNKEQREKAIDEAGEMLYKFGEKFSKLKPLDIDHNNRKEVANNYREMFYRGKCAFDLGQEIARFQGGLKAKYGVEKYDNATNSLAHGSIPYTTVNAKTASPYYAAAEKLGTRNGFQGGIHRLACISAMGEHSANELNTSGKTPLDLGKEDYNRKVGTAPLLVGSDHPISNNMGKVAAGILQGKNIVTAKLDPEGVPTSLETDFSKISKPAKLNAMPVSVTFPKEKSIPPRMETSAKAPSLEKKGMNK